ncbi:hypothetical protein EUGRSUZ_F02594 [Eucalyptus grandis]|uniref:Uncharacterized protein n=2 Tax=Eucalyptus grandis TaxID=71139 RepID=A0ACC3KHZ2_EUCGR|nr:hypothetical protein EUGRSUZ_F02594 [Eucalyptus grandis]
MSTNSPVVRVREKIDLTEKEKMIFERLLATVRHFDLSTQLRVTGGWVRDKVVVYSRGRCCLHSDWIFCGKLDQSKHLERARMRLYDIWIDL